MAGILNFYGYDNGANFVLSQKQQQANIDNEQNKKIKELEDGGGGGGCHPQCHPDISTQASLLPQKFGNLDMYEKLIPVSDLDPYDIGYVAEGEEKGMVVTSCFLISDTLSMAGVVHISRDYYYDGDKPIGDLVVFSGCDSSYNIMEFQYILIQYYTPSNNPYYYYDDSEDDGGDDGGDDPQDVEEIGAVSKNASNLSISIDDNTLPEGTYTMEYEDSTGKPLEGIDKITEFTIN